MRKILKWLKYINKIVDKYSTYSTTKLNVIWLYKSHRCTHQGKFEWGKKQVTEDCLSTILFT